MVLQLPVSHALVLRDEKEDLRVMERKSARVKLPKYLKTRRQSIQIQGSWRGLRIEL